MPRGRWRYSPLPVGIGTPLTMVLRVGKWGRHVKAKWGVAMQRGVPYQTLISGIIHRYIEGDLVSKNG